LPSYTVEISKEEYIKRGSKPWEINRADAETHGIYYQKKIEISSKGLETMYADAERHNEFRIKEEVEEKKGFFGKIKNKILPAQQEASIWNMWDKIRWELWYQKSLVEQEENLERFINFCATLFYKIGYKVEIVERDSNNGIDIRVVTNEGLKVAVLCRNPGAGGDEYYQNLYDEGILKPGERMQIPNPLQDKQGDINWVINNFLVHKAIQIKELPNELFDWVIVMTTTLFTEDAIKMAQEADDRGIVLIDCNDQMKFDRLMPSDMSLQEIEKFGRSLRKS